MTALLSGFLPTELSYQVKKGQVQRKKAHIFLAVCQKYPQDHIELADKIETSNINSKEEEVKK